MFGVPTASVKCRGRRPEALGGARPRALAAGQGRGRRWKAAGVREAAVAGEGGGAGTGPEASRSAKRTLDAPLAEIPCRAGIGGRGVGPETGPWGCRHFLGVPPAAADPCPPARAGVRGLAPGCGFRAWAPALPLSRRRGRRPCRRRCGGTARGVRPGRGGRPPGRSPRRRPRRAGRSWSRA